MDGDDLLYNIIGMPPGMTVSEEGLVTWTPTNDDVGIYNLTISVTDLSGARATMVWHLEVINVNDAPEIDDIPPITVTEGKPYLHFGAVSRRAPDEDLYRERCLKLGENIARKAAKLFG